MHLHCCLIDMNLLHPIKGTLSVKTKSTWRIPLSTGWKYISYFCAESPSNDDDDDDDHIISYHIISYHIISYHIISWYIMIYHYIMMMTTMMMTWWWWWWLWSLQAHQITDLVDNCWQINASAAVLALDDEDDVDNCNTSSERLLRGRRPPCTRRPSGFNSG